LSVLAGTGASRLESRGLAQVDADWMALNLAFFRMRIFVFVYLWTIGLTKAAIGAVLGKFVADTGHEPD